jgi:hypothetical protein
MSSWVAVSEDDSDEEFATGPHHLLHHHHAGDGPGADGADLGRDGGGGEGVRGGAAAFESETIGAREARLLETYQSALTKQGSSSPGHAEWLQARDLYRGVIHDVVTFPPWIKQRRLQRQRTGSVNLQSLPVRLQYLCTKQLAAIADGEGDYALSLKCFVAALEVDSTDIVTWFQAGKTAMSPDVANLRLARHCFEQVLGRNPAHLVAARLLFTVLSEVGDDIAADRLRTFVLRNHTQRWAVPKSIFSVPNEAKSAELSSRRQKRVAEAVNGVSATARTVATHSVALRDLSWVALSTLFLNIFHEQHGDPCAIVSETRNSVCDIVSTRIEFDVEPEPSARKGIGNKSDDDENDENDEDDDDEMMAEEDAWLSQARSKRPAPQSNDDVHEPPQPKKRRSSRSRTSVVKPFFVQRKKDTRIKNVAKFSPRFLSKELVSKGPVSNGPDSKARASQASASKASASKARPSKTASKRRPPLPSTPPTTAPNLPRESRNHDACTRWLLAKQTQL